MDKVIASKTFTISGEELKRQWHEAKEFEADRCRLDDGGRVTYMAFAKGYVMIRRPHCIPYVVSEQEWRAMPLFKQGD